MAIRYTLSDAHRAQIGWSTRFTAHRDGQRGKKCTISLGLVYEP